MTGSRALVEVRGLRKEFAGKRRLLRREPEEIVVAVDDVSFEIHEGETFGLVGESGSGKSTIARLVTMLEEPDAGAIRFEGRDIHQLRGDELHEYRRRVQIIFQDPYGSLNPRMTLFQLISEAWKVHPTIAPPRRTWTEEVGELLDAVGLRPDHQSRYPDQFSGGQRQRIGIARALAAEPTLLVCDEPVSALDVSIQAQILRLLTDLQANRDLTIFFIAHDLSVVRAVCDRVAIAYRGSIMEMGPVRDVYHSPAHPYTETLMLAAPRFGATRRRKSDAAGSGDATSEAPPDSACRFAPRCAYQQPNCWDEDPDLIERSGVASRRVACFYPLSGPTRPPQPFGRPA